MYKLNIIKKILLLLFLSVVVLDAQLLKWGEDEFPNLTYGLQWNSTTDTYVRLGSASGKIQSAFNNLAPWKNIRRCNLADNGVVNAYYGQTGYVENGSNGQVMVQIPKFYYKVVILVNAYQWYISPFPLPGYTIHPMFVRNGVIQNYIYIGAFQGSAYDVTANAYEQSTITLTHKPTSSGNLAITLDGNYTFNIAVLSTDNMLGVANKILATGNKTDYQGTIWTVAKTDSTHLTYTSGSYGLKTTLTMPTAVGVTSTITKTVTGHGGYVLNDASGVSFTLTSGSKLSSVSNVKPLTGWNNSLTIANNRILAHNRGTGWEQLDFLTESGIQLLYLIEYGSFNSQTQISQGVTNITDDALTNMGINNGYTGTKSGGTNLGNTSGQVTVTHYQTGETTHAMSYRGIENWFGNVYQFIDGLNIQNNIPFVSDHSFQSDLFTSPYASLNMTLCQSNGYVKNISISNTYNYLFLPSTVGGSSSTYLADYYYQNSGNMIAYYGSHWPDGGVAGGFGWALDAGSGLIRRYFGGRLLWWNPSSGNPTGTPFTMTVTSATTIMSMKGSNQIAVDWGDGSPYDWYTLTTSAQNVAHTYSTSSTYTVKIYNPGNITYFSSTDNANYAFNISLLSLMSLDTFRMNGTNAVSGTLVVPASITTFSLVGGSVAGYSTQSFNNSINYFYLTINTGAGLNAAQVDQLFIDLDGSTWAGSGRTARVSGTSIATPTATSAAARTSLSTTKTVSVYTN